MTPTPEDTAFVAIQFWCDDPEGTDEDLRAILAQAIREAEDAAYERAALFCDGEAKASLAGGDAKLYAGRREAGRRLGRIVRSLKSTKEV